MKVLIVFAHPEPKSFGSRMLARSVEALKGKGHEVQVSDLYAMKFNPIASASDFSVRRFPDQLYYDREQKYAYQNDTFATDIQGEIDKLQWCDMLILQFPLWWFSVPAIMKGWIDRVFANGIAYGGGQKLDRGGLRGRTGMLSVTTNCYPSMADTGGLLGDIQINLWPLQHGTLAFCGLTVLPPFIGWSIQSVDDVTREGYLDQYAARMKTLEDTEPLAFHTMAEFGPDWRLLPGIEPRTVGHRRAPSCGEGG